jgi:hypothetical protein
VPHIPMRPSATYAGHGALFTHTDQYVGEIQMFLAAQTTTHHPVAVPRGETIARPDEL